MKMDAMVLIIFELILNALYLFLFLHLNKKFKNVDFITCMRDVLGKPLTFLILLIVVAYFSLKTFLTLKETENFLNTTIYEELTSALFIIPCLFVVFYVVSKGVKNISRVTQILSIIIFFGISLSLLLALPNVWIDGILPLFVADANTFLTGFLKASMWFGNYSILFFLIGRVKVDNQTFKKSMLGLVLSSIIVFLLFYIFYSIFQSGSFVHYFAISDITSFTPLLSSLSKLDWFTVVFYSFADIVQLILQVYTIVILMQAIFRKKFGFWAYSVLFAIVILLYLLLPFSAEEIVAFSANDLNIFGSVVNVALPLLACLVYVLRSKKQQRIKGFNLYEDDINEDKFAKISIISDIGSISDEKSGETLQTLRVKNLVTRKSDHPTVLQERDIQNFKESTSHCIEKDATNNFIQVQNEAQYSVKKSKNMHNFSIIVENLSGNNRLKQKTRHFVKNSRLNIQKKVYRGEL